MRFKSPVNDYVEECPHCGFWCLLFGGFYFLYKRIWSHAILGLVLSLVTFGASWLVYPVFAGRLVRRHYLYHGWEELEDPHDVLVSTPAGCPSCILMGLTVLLLACFLLAFIGRAYENYGKPSWSAPNYKRECELLEQRGLPLAADLCRLRDN